MINLHIFKSLIIAHTLLFSPLLFGQINLNIHFDDDHEL